MTDDRFDLSRRKLLGAATTVGAAGVMGGAGSLAFFSDEEEFANNALVAGDLDLKVDWQEHYSDWSPDESEAIDTVSMEPGPGLTGFPSAAPPEETSVYVSDPEQFLRNTAIEAFPDILSDPAESDATYDALQAQLDDDSDICDLPADLDGVLSHPFRTAGTFPSVDGDANPQTTQPGDSLVKISDLKPGDFGEVTLSFHVCGNPAFVWLTGELVEAAENGLTEPEAEDEQEDGDADSTDPADVELLDEIRAALWYDTGADGTYGRDFDDKDAGEGDNVLGEAETTIASGSLRDVLADLEDGGIPLDAVPSAGSGGGGGGGTGGDPDQVVPTVTGVDDNPQPDVFLSTGDPFNTQGARDLKCDDYETTLNDTGGYSLDLTGTDVEADDLDDVEEGDLCGGTTIDEFDVDAGTITLSSDGPVQVVSIKGGNQGEKIYVWDGGAADGGVVLDSVEFTTPENTGGQSGLAGISNVGVCCPDDDNGGNGGNGGGGQQNGDRQCFPNSTTGYVGFEWWLPIDHGNEIQTDSVEFDLGFYAEQCRHNDGDGMGNDGAGGGGDPDNGDDGDLPQGEGDISFVGACVEEGRDVTQAEANFRVTARRDDDSALTWAADVGIDAVTAFYGFQGGPRFTTYVFDEPQTSGTVETGADEDGTVGDEDGSPETTRFVQGGNAPESDDDQTPDDYCPDGYSEVEKIDLG